MISSFNLDKVLVRFQAAFMFFNLFGPAFDSGFKAPPPVTILDWFWISLGTLATIFTTLAYRQLKENFTIRPEPKKGTSLQTRWPFSISRHPMYAGGLLMCLSWAGIHGSKISTLGLFGLTVILYFKTIREEEYLVKCFGEKYLEYQKTVRRFF